MSARLASLAALPGELAAQSRGPLAGRDEAIFTSRDSKLEAARAKRLGAKSRAAEQAIAHTVLM